jgi:hypothetical protein
MAKKKQKQAGNRSAISDKNYLASGRGRKLPIYKCEINRDWEEAGMAQIIVYRQHVNGHLTVGVYLVDIFCAGIKDTFYYFNESASYIHEIFSKALFERDTISYDLAHNIIYGAVAYAEDLGIDPDPAFKLTQQILEEDTDAIPLIELPFGRNGKPVLVLNSTDPRNNYYLRQLEKNLAPGEYHVENLFEEDDFEDGDEDDEYPDEPELWDEEDWEYFIDETIPEELELRLTVATYMYRKITPVPAEAVPVMAAVSNAPAFTISDEALPDLAYSPAPDEQAEIKDIEDELNKQMQELEEVMLQKLEEATKKLDQNQNEPEEDKPITGAIVNKANQLALAARLQQNIARWPQNLIFYKQLIQIYQHGGFREEANGAVKDFYQKFPDYLLAKVCYADYLIKQDELEQVMPVFNGQYSLAAIYPEQNTFYIDDVVKFYSLMSRYFLQKEDVFLSVYFFNLLNELEISEDIPVDILTILKLNQAIVEIIKPVFENAKHDEAKKLELIDLLLS